MSSVARMVDAFTGQVGAIFPQPLLAISGFGLLALVPIGLLWACVDHRRIGQESIAAKPTKFFLSLGVHALSLSWAFSFVQEDHRDSFFPMITVWVALVASSWELVCITSQAIRGRRSHFNIATRYDSLVYISMGIFATLLIAANLPLAYAILVRPEQNSSPVVVLALVVGLVGGCFFGGGTGLLMGRRNSHGVGKERRLLPVLGWSVDAGDYRVAHFLGIHALQALPLVAFFLAAISPRYGMFFSIVWMGLYTALTVVTFLRAKSGRPLIPEGFAVRP